MDIKNDIPLEPTTQEGIIIRKGLFLAASRTFGEGLMEPLVRNMFGYIKSDSDDCDAICPKTNERGEIKFARAMTGKPNEKKKSLFEKIETQAYSDPLTRLVKFDDRLVIDYIANIQNVKRDHFNFLLYGILFCEGISFFRIKRENIYKISNWSDKHGRYDEEGKSGQFPIYKKNILLHEKEYFIQFKNYDELARLTKEINIDE